MRPKIGSVFLSIASTCVVDYLWKCYFLVCEPDRQVDTLRLRMKYDNDHGRVADMSHTKTTASASVTTTTTVAQTAPPQTTVWGLSHSSRSFITIIHHDQHIIEDIRLSKFFLPCNLQCLADHPSRSRRNGRVPSREMDQRNGGQ